MMQVHRDEVADHEFEVFILLVVVVSLLRDEQDSITHLVIDTEPKFTV